MICVRLVRATVRVTRKAPGSVPYQPRPSEALVAALDAYGAPEGEDDRRLGRIIKDMELTPPSPELVAAGLRYLQRHGGSRNRLGVTQFMSLKRWLESNVQLLSGEMESARAGEVSNAHVDTLRAVHRAGVTSLGDRSIRELVQEMAASDRHRPEVRENLAHLAAELGVAGAERPAAQTTPTGESSAPDGDDARQPWPPAHLLDDLSSGATEELVRAALEDLLEWMRDLDHDSEEQVRGLDRATVGQRLLAVAIHYVNYVGVESSRLGDFLASGSGWSAGQVADGLQVLGFGTIAALLRDLLSGLPVPLPILPEGRAGAWASLDIASREDSMEHLAEQVTLLWDEQRLLTAAAAYIRAHPAEFFVGPNPA